MARTGISRLKRLLGWVGVAIGLAAAALPAGAKTITYVPDGFGVYGAYVVEWKPASRARAVDWRGARTGTFTDDGVQRLVTLEAPFTYESTSVDVGCDGNQYLQRFETHQIVFRQAEGTQTHGKTSVVEIGVIVDIDGCTPGKVVPFGSPGDVGSAWLNRGYGARVPMTDVLAGFSIAGFFETSLPAGAFGSAPADIVTLDTATQLRFHATGTVVEAALNSEQWLVLHLPGLQLGYTRLSIDGTNTAETWLVGEFVGGKLQTVRETMMVKPVAGTSFGTLGQTARMWESWVGRGTDYPFFIYLYRNFSGDRVSKDLTDGSEFRTPIGWSYQGTNIVQTRTFGDRTYERTWVPLANKGNYRVVMEQEWSIPLVGTPTLRIAPRVNYYRNTGPATPLP